MSLVNLVKQLDELIEMAKPMAGVFGYGSIVKLTDSALEIATNILEAYDNSRVVLDSDDETFIREKLKKLQDENDLLASRLK